MSVTKQITIWCDENGCANWDQISGNVDYARNEAKRMGWSQITRDKKRIDLCPSCTKKDELK